MAHANVSEYVGSGRIMAVIQRKDEVLLKCNHVLNQNAPPAENGYIPLDEHFVLVLCPYCMAVVESHMFHQFFDRHLTNVVRNSLMSRRF